MPPFTLHPQLEKDCFEIADLKLCKLLLMNDQNFPWCILVPMRPDKREIYELDEVDQLQLNRESTQLARAMMKLFDGEKMNVAALGNMVPQLHIHHIVRHRKDAAWPGPVWGKVPPAPYFEEEAKELIARIRSAL